MGAAGFSPVCFSASAPKNPNPRHSPRGNVRMRKFSWSPWQRGLPLNLHNIWSQQRPVSDALPHTVSCRILPGTSQDTDAQRGQVTGLRTHSSGRWPSGAEGSPPSPQLAHRGRCPHLIPSRGLLNTALNPLSREIKVRLRAHPEGLRAGEAQINILIDQHSDQYSGTREGPDQPWLHLLR